MVSLIGTISGGGEPSQMDGNYQRWTWRGGITGGGEVSQVQGSYHRWRGARAGLEPELSEVEGSYHR